MHSHRPHVAAERPNFDADSRRVSYDSQLPNAVEREQLLEIGSTCMELSDA